MQERQMRINSSDYQKRSRSSLKRLAHLYGGWNDFLAQIGEPVAQRRIPDEIIKGTFK